MELTEFRTLLQTELPSLIKEDPTIRDYILKTVSQLYAEKQDTESKFDKILAELQKDREEQNRRWDEQNRKWEEQNQFNKQILQEIKKLHNKYENSIGALGARWGLRSESSFRNALKGILEKDFGLEVLHIIDYDASGEVFGYPEQIEIDILIKNGFRIACEIKSSISKAEMYIFAKKINFYQKLHNKPITRKIVISPMVDPREKPAAKNLGIEIFSYATDNIIDTTKDTKN